MEKCDIETDNISTGKKENLKETTQADVLERRRIKITQNKARRSPKMLNQK